MGRDAQRKGVFGKKIRYAYWIGLGTDKLTHRYTSYCRNQLSLTGFSNGRLGAVVGLRASRGFEIFNIWQKYICDSYLTINLSLSYHKFLNFQTNDSLVRDLRKKFTFTECCFSIWLSLVTDGVPRKHEYYLENKMKNFLLKNLVVFISEIHYLIAILP